jgi:hypothetical protein
MAKINIDQLVELAFAVEEGDPFDWNTFKQGKEQAMKMIAASILEQFDKDEVTDNDHVIMLATITKLVTENMILHAQLMQAKK